MAGWMVGSLLFNWVLCSALNAFVEQQVAQERLVRRSGFLIMVAALVCILVMMSALCLWVFPGSALASAHYLTAEHAQPQARASALNNGLFVLAYAGFQLRRY